MAVPTVGLVTGFYYPDSTGGTEAYVQMLADGLVELGYEVAIAAPGPDERRYTHGGHDVFRYATEAEPSAAQLQRRAAPTHLDAFDDWLDEAQPDLVHMHTFNYGCSIYHARSIRERGLPLFFTMHVPGVTCPRGTLMRWGEVPCDGTFDVQRCGACCLQKEGLSRPFADLAARWSAGPSRLAPESTLLQFAHLLEQGHERTQELFDRSERVVVVAHWLREVLLRNDVSDEKIIVSPHGLPPTSIPDTPSSKSCDDGTPDGPLRIGFVGRFTEVKGVGVLVDAVRQLPADRNVRLHLYGMTGSEEDEAYLDAVRQRADGDDRIVFEGPLTEDNRDAAYAAFDVLAVPSTWLETGPLVVLEAFAAGIPVVGSNAGGIAERVEGGVSGVLAEPGNTEAWTQALDDLAQAYHRGDWSWSLPGVRTHRDIAKDMDTLYTSVLSAAQTP
jgi:glycosyltransferase involved in cell wall biosynthesis